MSDTIKKSGLMCIRCNKFYDTKALLEKHSCTGKNLTLIRRSSKLKKPVPGAGPRKENVNEKINELEAENKALKKIINDLIYGADEKVEAPAGGTDEKVETPSGGTDEKAEAPAGGTGEKVEAPAGGTDEKVEAPAGGTGKAKKQI